VAFAGRLGSAAQAAVDHRTAEEELAHGTGTLALESDFKGIPLEQVSQLVAALSAELPPVRTMQLVEPSAMG
jgi:hypothetical protein